jgi:hypothetical protein
LCITIFLQLDKLPLNYLDCGIRSLLDGVRDGVHRMVAPMDNYTCRTNNGNELKFKRVKQLVFLLYKCSFIRSPFSVQ